MRRSTEEIKGLLTNYSQDAWTCCGFTATDLDGSPKAALCEAIVLLGYLMVDAEGRSRPQFRIPPAFAVALVEAFNTPEPLQTIHDLINANLDAHTRRSSA